MPPELQEAITLHRAGRLEPARRAYGAILEQKPTHAHALFLLGALESQAGRHEEGCELIERSLASNRRLPEAHLNHGTVLARMGRQDDAVEAFRRAIKLRQTFAEAYAGLADALLALGKATDAEKTLRDGIKRCGASVPMQQRLSLALMRQDRLEESLTEIRKALAEQPDDPSLRHAEHAVLTRVVPRWHFPMINEARRNDAYQKAIESAVSDGAHVLEVGTGSGLLAMMAARAGAAHVTTCEVVPVLAERAREIVAANGFADRITVVNKRSNELVVGEDLPRRADLLISEVLSDDFISEGVIPSIRHARQQLCVADAPMIPIGGAVMGALVTAPELERQIGVSQVSGFDLSAFNAFAPRKFEWPHANCDLELLSAPAELMRIDLRTVTSSQLVEDATLTADRAGTALGVMQWIRAELDGDTTYENAPTDGFSHWAMIFYRFPESLVVSPGDDVRVRTAVVGGSRGLEIERLDASV